MNSSNKNSTYMTLNHWYKFKLELLFEGLLVGVITGLIVVLYRLSIDKVGILANNFISLQKEHPVFIVANFFILIVIASIVKKLITIEPLIKGSGIPQVEGYLLRLIDMRWLKIIFYKFIGGILAIGAGLSLGREGPSIQLGGCIGKGISQLFKRKKVEEKFLITAGASAGLAAAFNAPLAGLMFSLEEVHKNFSPIILSCALIASVSADFVSKEFFGVKPVFEFNNLEYLPLKYYKYVIILGIIVGLLGVFYNKMLLKSQEFYKKNNIIPQKYRFYIPFILAGVAAFLMPEVLRGGHGLIESLVSLEYSIKLLIVLLCVKFIFTMFSYGSGAPGGIFLPLLVIGAIIGTIYGGLINHFFGVEEIYIQNMMILAMSAYFCSIVRAPITGCILISEMTGTFHHFLALAIVTIVAFVIADLMKSDPIYESLLEGIVKKQGHKFESDSRVKVILEIFVQMESFLDGKSIREINWPVDCLLVGIKRGNKEIIPKGNTVLQATDCIIVLTNEDLAAKTKTSLKEMAATVFL